MSSDLELLRQYAGGNSEDAFATVLRRHVDLVYSAALRQVRSPELAEEIAQSVFTDLARNAARLKPDTILSAWLYQVTRRTAVDVIRRESRRQARERAAQESGIMNEQSADWRQLEPLLDEAMAALDDTDRAAILLRFFENKSLREVGEQLGSSEDAAQKRVSRAVERLREFLARRGAAIGAGSIVAAISTNAVHSAPAALGSTITTALAVAPPIAIHAGAAAAATRMLAMTTIQKATIAGLLAIGIGMAVFETRQSVQSKVQLGNLQRQQADLGARLLQAERERDDFSNRLAALRDENSVLRSNLAELPGLRGGLARATGRIRELADSKIAADQQTNDAMESIAQSWVKRARLLKDWASAHPDQRIPEMQLLGDNDWLAAVQNWGLSNDKEYRRGMADLRHAAQDAFVPKLSDALHRYLKASGDQFPNDLSKLAPYFDSPANPAILQRYEIVPEQFIDSVKMGPWAITQKAPVDEEYDNRNVIGAYGTGGTEFRTSMHSGVEKLMAPVLNAFLAANNGQLPTSPSDLLPYATTPEQQTMLQKAINEQSAK
jgi:RNA polymerase sigma factor (sigma-70 family)